jgi:hypothetical protein
MDSYNIYVIANLKAEIIQLKNDNANLKKLLSQAQRRKVPSYPTNNVIKLKQRVIELELEVTALHQEREMLLGPSTLYCLPSSMLFRTTHPASSQKEV